MASKIVILLVAVICSLVDIGRPTIILDSGNPARAIRGTAMDANFAEFHQTQENILEEQNQQEPISVTSVITRMEDIISEVEGYNNGITKEMTRAAMDVGSGKSCLQICQLARTRLTALEIVNALQALSIDVKNAFHGDVDEAISESQLKNVIAEAMSGLTKSFDLIQSDLRSFNEDTFSPQALRHFTQGLQMFTSLENAVARTR